MENHSNQITNYVLGQTLKDTIYLNALRHYSPNILSYLIDEDNYNIDNSSIFFATMYINAIAPNIEVTALEWIKSTNSKKIREKYTEDQVNGAIDNNKKNLNTRS